MEILLSFVRRAWPVRVATLLTRGCLGIFVVFLGCLATTLETIVRGTHVLVTVTAGGPRVRIVNFHAVARGAQSKGHGLGLADQRGAGVDGELHGLSGVVLIAVGLVVGCAATRGLEAGDVEGVFDGEPKPGERPSPGVG